MLPTITTRRSTSGGYLIVTYSLWQPHILALAALSVRTFSFQPLVFFTPRLAISALMDFLVSRLSPYFLRLSACIDYSSFCYGSFTYCLLVGAVLEHISLEDCNYPVLRHLRRFSTPGAGPAPLTFCLDKTQYITPNILKCASALRRTIPSPYRIYLH
jgi:hypothetical protein